MHDTDGVRRQLTLFVPHGVAADIDAVRQRVDPVQFGLIAAHVTLCREDELVDLPVAVLRGRLARAGPLTLVFGLPVRFGDHGMLLPCIDGAVGFHQLRVAALATTAIRPHAAHVTLAHPRNPRAPENVDATFASLPPRFEITFAAVALIEQRSVQPWVVREILPLDSPEASERA